MDAGKAGVRSATQPEVSRDSLKPNRWRINRLAVVAPQPYASLPPYVRQSVGQNSGEDPGKGRARLPRSRRVVTRYTRSMVSNASAPISARSPAAAADSTRLVVHDGHSVH